MGWRLCVGAAEMFGRVACTARSARAAVLVMPPPACVRWLSRVGRPAPPAQAAPLKAPVQGAAAGVHLFDREINRTTRKVRDVGGPV